MAEAVEDPDDDRLVLAVDDVFVPFDVQNVSSDPE